MLPLGYNQPNSYYGGGNPYQPQNTWLPSSNPQPNLSQYQVPSKVQSYIKTVSNESEIMPNEVPMDGTIALFPLNDYSRIFAKQWTKNGTIETVVYTPEKPEVPIEQPKIPEDLVKSLTDHMDAKFDELLSTLTEPGGNNA